MTTGKDDAHLNKMAMEAIARVETIEGLGKLVGGFTAQERKKLEQVRQEVTKGGLEKAKEVLGSDFVQNIILKVKFSLFADMVVDAVRRQARLQMKRLKEQIDSLPNGERAVMELLFGLRNGRSKTAAQVAKELHISVSTVNRRKRKVLAKIKPQAQKVIG